METVIHSDPHKNVNHYEFKKSLTATRPTSHD